MGDLVTIGTVDGVAIESYAASNPARGELAFSTIQQQTILSTLSQINGTPLGHSLFEAMASRGDTIAVIWDLRVTDGNGGRLPVGEVMAARRVRIYCAPSRARTFPRTTTPRTSLKSKLRRHHNPLKSLTPPKRPSSDAPQTRCSFTASVRASRRKWAM